MIFLIKMHFIDKNHHESKPLDELKRWRVKEMEVVFADS